MLPPLVNNGSKLSVWTKIKYPFEVDFAVHNYIIIISIIATILHNSTFILSIYVLESHVSS